MNKAPGINVKAVRADARLEWDSMPDVKKQVGISYCI